MPSNTDFELYKQAMGGEAKVEEGGKPEPIQQNQPIIEKVEPAQEQQVVQEIVIDAPEPAKETPKEDFNSFLSGKFGRDEATLKQELQELQTLRETVKADPYKSPLGKQFDNLVAQGVNAEAAIRYLTVDETKLGDKEVLLFKMQRESPNATAEQISRYIDKKYGLGDFAPKKDDGEGNMIKDEEAEKDNLFQLQMDSQPVRKEFKSLQEELIKPVVSRETIASKTAEQQRVEGWKPLKSKLREEFKQIQIPYGNRDGKPIATLKAAVKNFDFTDAEIDQIIQSNPNLKPDAEGVKYLNQVLEDAYFLRNRADLFYKVGEYARSMNDKQWQQTIHNPQLKNGQTQDFGGTSSKTKDDQLVEGFMKALK